jgi:ATP synthase protein I
MHKRGTQGFRPLRVSSYNPEALLVSSGFRMVVERVVKKPVARSPDERQWEDWDEDQIAKPVKALTREQAQALREKDPPLSPWRVVGVQLVVGAVMALLTALVTGRQELGWSLLYGAATVVVPGALMARGMTSRLSSMSLGASAVSFMLWEMVKIAVSVGMLMLAPKLVQPLSWPALLAGLVICIKVYWVALLWRGQRKTGKN